MLQLVEEALDQVALPIDPVIDRALDTAVAGGRDVRPSATSLDEIDDSSDVKATVSERSRSGLSPSIKVGAMALPDD